MNLNRNTVPSREMLYGEDDAVLTAGQRLTVETSPGGAEILDEEVPTGKVWTVKVSVSVDEADA